jgi:hypothetical protein
VKNRKAQSSREGRLDNLDGGLCRRLRERTCVNGTASKIDATGRIQKCHESVTVWQLKTNKKTVLQRAASQLGRTFWYSNEVATVGRRRIFK